MLDTLTLEWFWSLPPTVRSVPLSLHSKVKNKNLYLATFASVLGPMSFGFVLGYSSPVIPELTRISDPRLRLDSIQASWFGVWWQPWWFNITCLKAEQFLDRVLWTCQQFYAITCHLLDCWINVSPRKIVCEAKHVWSWISRITSSK